MPRELTAKVVEEMGIRLAEIDGKITKIETSIEEATSQATKISVIRISAILIGVPAALTAFVFLAFMHDAFYGWGAYYGIGLSVVALLASRIGMAMPASLVPAFERQRSTLLGQREKFQVQIQSYAKEAESSATEAAS
jgi:hypothetical protein